MVAGMQGCNIGRQPPGAMISRRSAPIHSGDDCHQSSSSFLVADAKVLSPAPAGRSSYGGALPSSLATTLRAPRCSHSREHNARRGASFLGLSVDTDREEVCKQADALLPQSLSVSSSSTRMPSRRLLGTCFLDMGHAPASSPEFASSLFHSQLDHVHSSSPELASSFFLRHHFTQDPEVATDRAAAAAEHAENDASFALHKALGVTKIADAAVLYCYSAVFVAMAMAALGIANGAIDWYATKRDQDDVEETEKDLAQSGWPEYLRRRQSGGPADQAGGQLASASSGNEPRRSIQQPGRPAVG